MIPVSLRILGMGSKTYRRMIGYDRINRSHHKVMDLSVLPSCLSPQPTLRYPKPPTIPSSSSLIQHKYTPHSSILPKQPPPNASRSGKPRLRTRVWLMELNRLLHIQLGWTKLPTRSVKLLSHEPYQGHGVEEVLPRNLSRWGGHVGVAKKRVRNTLTARASTSRVGGRGFLDGRCGGWGFCNGWGV